MAEFPKLTLTAQFDDLMRCTWGLINSDVTNTLLEFVIAFEELSKKGLHAENECQRLQTELNKSMFTISNLESKLAHARNMFDSERRAKLKLEKELEVLDRNIALARDLLFNDHANYLADETRAKLQFLNNTTIKSRRSTETNKRHSRLNTINELESTGSLLSDLSYSRSEEDLDTTGDWNANIATKEEIKKRRSATGKVIEINPNDRVVATTMLTVGKGGDQIHARSIIEAVPEEDEKGDETPGRRKSGKGASRSKYDTPISPIINRLRDSEVSCRQHTFVQKNFLSGIGKEICSPCGKKIRFGVPTSRCKDCRATVHPKCQNSLPIPCIPVGDTPILKGTMGCIADYAPKFPPMIPALIVHCINEVEFRGLEEIGPYRIPGSEKDVKLLKEKYLRGKGVPNLTDIDIPIICSTIKDFLRSLREPLLTNTLSNDFITAVEANDTRDIEPALYQVIADLPQPNRDTLAFLMLHLQKVAESKHCKMPISNLAKIFGPTLVAVSKMDNDEYAYSLSDLPQQIAVVEHLLKIPSDYWLTFVNLSGLQQPRPYVAELKQTLSTDSLLKNHKNFFNTPTGPGNYGQLRSAALKRKFFTENSPQKKKTK